MNLPIPAYSIRPGGRRPGTAAPTLALILLMTGVVVAPAAAGAQDAERERWREWVYVPGEWRGSGLVEERTTDETTEALALSAVIDVYARAPRWRAEVRTVEDGRPGEEPLVLVSDGARTVVLTPLGSTALEEHEAASDPVVRDLLSRIGEHRPASRDRTRWTYRHDDERVRRIVRRGYAARAEFENALLQTGTARRLGSRAMRFGIHAIGGEREEVVATAGARGVVEVETVDGVVRIEPDSAAIVRMQRTVVDVLDLDRFLREGRLGAHQVRTEDAT